MTTLVTGATGFIGSNLVRALVSCGQEVRVLHRANSSLISLDGLRVEHVPGDILDEDSVGRAVKGCERVYHVAARVDYWRATKQQLFQTNITGTEIVMQACLRANVDRVIHTSSVSAIGLPPPGTLGTEDTPFDARSARFAYAESKRMAEVRVQEMVQKGLPAVIVNPVIVVGARDYSTHILAFVQEFERGHVFAVPPGGACVADVDAIVEGEMAAAEKGRVGERYILGGENLTYREMIAAMADALGRPAPRRVVTGWPLELAAAAIDLVNAVGPKPLVVSGEQIRLSAGTYYYDSGKAVRELNYPLIPFQETVEKTCRWFRENGYLNGQ